MLLMRRKCIIIILKRNRQKETKIKKIKELKININC
jgi:hypothetical protein